MNTSSKAIEWLICFSIENLMLILMNLVHCQKQLECHQHILNKSHFDSSKPMKMLARTGAKGEPMATPSI